MALKAHAEGFSTGFETLQNDARHSYALCGFSRLLSK